MSRKPYLAKDLERLALHYAIEERLGWLASIGHPPQAADVEPAARAQALVDGWRAMLSRRFREESMSDRIRRESDEQVRISIFESIRGTQQSGPKP